MPRIVCPKCSSSISFKELPDSERITCPSCGKRLKLAGDAPAKQAGGADELPMAKLDSPTGITASPRPKVVGVRKEKPRREERDEEPKKSMTPWLIAGGGIFVLLLLTCGGIAFGMTMLLKKPMSTTPAEVVLKDDPEANRQIPKSSQKSKKKKDDGPFAQSKAADDGGKAAQPGPVQAAPGGKLSGQQVYETVLKSTVWIKNPGVGSGTGILFNAQEQLVLTNYHVVFRKNPLPASDTVRYLRNVTAKLDKSDPVNPEKKHYKAYDQAFMRGSEYQINMASKDFDSFLQVLDAKGQVLAFDDDGGGDLDASIIFNPPADGKYRIIATSFRENELGEFRLTVSQIIRGAGSGTSQTRVSSTVNVCFPDYAGGAVVAQRQHYETMIQLAPDNHTGRVVAWSEAKDLAVIKLTHLPASIPGLALAKSSGTPGQAVHSIGNPGASGAMWVYTSGTVRTAPYHKQWGSFGGGIKMLHDAWVIETQSPTNPGDSGGPLVNDNGDLVAVTQGSNIGANAINLFVDIREVRTFLKEKKLGWTER